MSLALALPQTKPTFDHHFLSSVLSVSSRLRFLSRIHIISQSTLKSKITRAPLMGLCASSQIMSRQNGRFSNFPYTVMVIHSDGKLQEFKQPIRAGKLLSQNPNCFLCCSETMNVDSVPIQMAEDDELQAGQLYFLMPVSKSHALITLQDLCTLAIKASTALNDSESRRAAMAASSPFLDENCAVKLWGRAEGSCRIPNSGNGGVVCFRIPNKALLSMINSWNGTAKQVWRQ